MCELDKALEVEPSASRIIEIVELGIRNRICFRELEYFNKAGRFLYEHPLIQKNTLRSTLVALMKSDPQAFLEDHKNVSNNVSRYKSFLNRKKAKETDKKKWQTQLNKHTEKLALMAEIMQEMNYGKNN
jgi:hypothetical protein